MKLHDFGAHEFLNMRNDGIRLDSNTDLYLVGVLRARSSKKKKKIPSCHYLPTCMNLSLQINTFEECG